MKVEIENWATQIINSSPPPVQQQQNNSQRRRRSKNNKLKPDTEAKEEENMKAAAVRNLYAWQAATPYNDPDGLCGGGQGHGVTGYRATLDCKGERGDVECLLLISIQLIAHSD